MRFASYGSEDTEASHWEQPDDTVSGGPMVRFASDGSRKDTEASASGSNLMTSPPNRLPRDNSICTPPTIM